MKDVAARKNASVLCAFPQLFDHPVDSSRDDRGSNRVLTTKAKSIADLDFVFIPFLDGVGAFERMQTDVSLRYLDCTHVGNRNSM